jgi:hypothetical protein
MSEFVFPPFIVGSVLVGARSHVYIAFHLGSDRERDSGTVYGQTTGASSGRRSTGHGLPRAGQSNDTIRQTNQNDVFTLGAADGKIGAGNAQYCP